MSKVDFTKPVRTGAGRKAVIHSTINNLAIVIIGDERGTFFANDDGTLLHANGEVSSIEIENISEAADLLEAAEEVLKYVDPSNDAGQQPLRQLADAVRRAKGV